MIHDVKCWPGWFQDLFDGAKTFELRLNDRDYRVGDFLREREWNNGTQQYTGRECTVFVHGLWQHLPGLVPDYVAMAVQVIRSDDPPDPTATCAYCGHVCTRQEACTICERPGCEHCTENGDHIRCLRPCRHCHAVGQKGGWDYSTIPAVWDGRPCSVCGGSGVVQPRSGD